MGSGLALMEARELVHSWGELKSSCALCFDQGKTGQVCRFVPPGWATLLSSLLADSPWLTVSQASSNDVSLRSN